MRRESVPFPVLAALALGLSAAPAAAAPLAASDLMRLQRISDPQVSPDGGWVLFTATEVDLAANTRNNDLWVAPLKGLAGGPGGRGGPPVEAARAGFTPAVAGGPGGPGGPPAEGARAGFTPARAERRLTSHPRSDSRGRWSRDGRRIAFVSAREGTPQVYLLDMEGGEPRRVTSLPTGAGGVLWIDDRTLLVTSDVDPACGADADCNRKKLEAEGKPSSARAYDMLLYRHWDTWEDLRRSHLLVVPLDGGPVRDLTPGERDVPPFSLGGPDDYAVSPDGSEVAFVRKDDPVEASSTNGELFVVSVAGGAPRKVSGQPGYDGAPLWSPDGRLLAFRSQARAGYESDRWRLMVWERATGAVRNLTESFDRHVESFAWSKDSKTIYFAASHEARQPVYAVPAAGGALRMVLAGHTLDELQAAADGRTLVATKSSLTRPAEVYRFQTDGTGLAAVTQMNEAVLAPYNLRPAESVTYEGAAGKDVQAWIVKPADFDPARRYPLLVLIHGGPQSVWGDAWSYRWNPQVFAAAGYVVFMPNPRGSVGWGQEFIDDINRDWGGRAYEDVMKGTDWASNLPYVDRERTAAAGASFGGYLVNWIAGHTHRFDALVSHDGVFDLASMYGGTEELWFVEWEFGGPYWESPEQYERWSPSRFVERFKTPTLVIHGELDYRVPLEQGLGMFTALQRRGVPSRLIVFPDEHHWVLKPANSVRWYGEVTGWLDRWVKK